MKTDKYERITFTVDAVQVTLANIEDVAKWCKGKVEQREARLLGTTTLLPVIVIKGTGDHRGKTFEAALGCWVVHLRGSFRSYKPLQFDSAFRPVADSSAEGLQEAEAHAHAELFKEPEIADAEIYHA